MNWIKIEEKLPPANTLVWIRRYPTSVEHKPLFLGMRSGDKLSTDPDPSVNCIWDAIHVKSLASKQPSRKELKFTYSFSDVTVIEWAFVQSPI